MRMVLLLSLMTWVNFCTALGVLASASLILDKTNFWDPAGLTLTEAWRTMGRGETVSATCLSHILVCLCGILYSDSWNHA